MPRWRLGTRGIAAVEFALIVPVLLILFIGTVEVVTLYRTEAKLNAAAFNTALAISIAETVSTANPPIADIAATASEPAMSVTSLNDLCRGAVLGVAPYPSAGMTIDMASITEEAGPNGTPTTAPVYNATRTYDLWEADSSVSGSTCTTSGGSAIIGDTSNSGLVYNAENPTSTSLVEVPCDNVIIVKVSLPYAGITGLILKNRPTLTQTAYVRWRTAAPTTEITCAGCTLSSAPKQVCNALNTTATN